MGFRRRRGVLLGIGGMAIATVAAGIACNDYDSDPDFVLPDAGSPTSETSTATTTDAPNTDHCVDGTTLQHADSTTQKCEFDCVVARCTGIHPTGPMPPELLQTAGVKAITFAGSARFDTNTGAIDKLREANTDPLKLEVKSDIGFQIVAIDSMHKLAIWAFDSLEVPANVVLTFTSSNAAAFAVAKTAKIVGTIDLRGYNSNGALCAPEPGGASSAPMLAGPGGGNGASEKLNGGGPGGALGAHYPQAFYNPGLGGGGFAAAGGAGGPRDGGPDNGNSGPGSPGGAAYGEPLLNPLLGGSGGAGSSSRPGGGGGGAFQLVAGEKIVIGDGTTVGGINAGGCGGFAASTAIPGGGGGSGGAILLETLSIEINAKSGLAANGGSGAGENPGLPGALANGQTGPGGQPGVQYGAAGFGGGGIYLAGTAGGEMPAGGFSGGSGGGSAGRIRINTRTGIIVVPPQAVLSPPQGANGPTTTGTLRVD